MAFEEVYDLFCHQGLYKLLTRKEKRRMLKVYSLITDEYIAPPGKVARLAKEKSQSNGYDFTYNGNGPQVAGWKCRYVQSA